LSRLTAALCALGVVAACGGSALPAAPVAEPAVDERTAEKDA
jgi:hypothetical protein